MIRIRIAGAGRLGERLRRIESDLHDAVAKAVEESAEALGDTARQLVGRSSVAGPSAPGEPPRKRTGRLQDSIAAEVGPSGLSARVGTDLVYGAHLEFGTRDMAARPWLLPAFADLRPRIKARIARAVRDALRESARR
ncbi:MAG: HK97 gp10 family phage protein [Kiloniellaceae bacterium]